MHLAIELAFPDHWAGSPDRLLGISYADWSRLLWIPAAFFLVALPGIYARTSAFVGRLGKLGVILAATGLGLDILGNLIEFWVFGLLLAPFLGGFQTGSEGSQLGYSIASLGAWITMAGLLLLGTSALRSKLPARWRYLIFSIGLIYVSALFFFIVELVSLHASLLGLNWIVLGYFLWKDKITQQSLRG